MAEAYVQFDVEPTVKQLVELLRQVGAVRMWDPVTASWRIARHHGQARTRRRRSSMSDVHAGDPRNDDGVLPGETVDRSLTPEPPTGPEQIVEDATTDLGARVGWGDDRRQVPCTACGGEGHYDITIFSDPDPVTGERAPNVVDQFCAVCNGTGQVWIV